MQYSKETLCALYIYSGFQPPPWLHLFVVERAPQNWNLELGLCNVTENRIFVFSLLVSLISMVGFL